METVSSPEAATSHTFRVEQADGTFTYYVCLIYEKTDSVVYEILGIDLASAVSMGALNSYQDTFDRADPRFDPDAAYVRYETVKTWSKMSAPGDAVVTENAPAVSGYVVYLHNSQTLALQSQAGTNQIFFYYVKDGSSITYDITFYLERDGRYSEANMVRFSHIPAVSGEILQLSQLEEIYALLLHQAREYSTYGQSSDANLQDLYEKYKGMTITLVQGDKSGIFTVDANSEDTLDLEMLSDLPLDYHLSGWSPSGETLVLSEDVRVDVYLEMAELLVQKVNTEGQPLRGAVFVLERLIPCEDSSQEGSILHEDQAYTVDPDFHLEGVSDASGRIVFQNLSAWVGEDGTGYLYRLTETEAPAGYNRLENSLFVTAPYTVDGEVSYLVTYTVTNAGISYLPNAGSFGGIYLVMLLGGAMMAAALTAAAILTRRRPGR